MNRSSVENLLLLHMEHGLLDVEKKEKTTDKVEPVDERRSKLADSIVRSCLLMLTHLSTHLCQIGTFTERTQHRTIRLLYSVFRPAVLRPEKARPADIHRILEILGFICGHIRTMIIQ